MRARVRRTELWLTAGSQNGLDPQVAGRRETDTGNVGGRRDTARAAGDSDAYAALMLGPRRGGDLGIDQILDRVYRRSGSSAPMSAAYDIDGPDYVDAEFEDLKPRWSPAARFRGAAADPAPAPAEAVAVEIEGVRLVPVMAVRVEARPAGQLDPIEDFFPRREPRAKAQPGRRPGEDLAAFGSTAMALGAKLWARIAAAVRRGLSRAARLRPRIDAVAARLTTLAQAGLRKTAALRPLLAQAGRSGGALLRRRLPELRRAWGGVARLRAVPPRVARRLAEFYRRWPRA